MKILKSLFMRFLAFIFISIVLLGCGNQSRDVMKLSFDLPKNKRDTLIIYYNNPIDFSQSGEYELILDSSGCGDIQLDWGNYVFARVDLVGKGFPVFISPAGELKVSGNTSDLPGSIRYSGTGAEANDYLAEVDEIYKEHEFWNNQFYGQLDSSEFLKRRAKIQSQIEAINTEAIENVSDSDTLRSILETEIIYRALFQDFNFEIYYGAPLDIDASKMLENPLFLNSYSVPHHLALELFLRSRVFKPIWSRYETENRDSINYIFPQLAYKEIMSMETSMQLKELFSSKLIYSYLSSAELTPSVDTIYEHWQSLFPESYYASILENDYKSILALESGIVAPEIYGKTPEGDSLLLSELKGKVIYIKVWATWCGPCLKSIPDWNKLQEEFEENEEVVFLSISTDADTDKWREMVRTRQLAGINIITDSKRIMDDYLIPGIPRYILIDQNARVVDARAQSPAEEEIKARILELM